MDLENILQDNLILVIPNNLKDKFLLKLNEIDSIFNIKILSLEKLIEKFTFKYDKQAIFFLMKKYNLKYEVAKVYLDNIRYVENKKYNIERLDKLVSIKNDLIENDLLIFDEIKNEFIKNKKIIVYGYDNIKKFDLKILKSLNAEIIEKKYNNYNPYIYEFDSIEEEVEFVASKIIELINNGIDINKIKISNISSEYYNVIYRIFNLYNIPIILNPNNSIYDTKIIKDFLILIKTNNVDDVLKLLKEKYDMSIDENKYIYNNIISILNDYLFIDNYNEIIDMLIYDFKKVKNYNVKLKKYVEEISIIDNYIDDDLYVFLISFNQGSIPAIYRDEDYITDELKKVIDLETTKEKNKIERKKWLNAIKTIKNLYITYKLKTPFETYEKSTLIDDTFNVIKNEKIEYKYSNMINCIHLGEKIDNLIKYGIKDDQISLLYNNYKNIPYMKYDNKFSGINKDDFYNYIDKKLLLSYSSIDNFYRCSFRYYVENILKLSEFEETFAINIGNIFHEILSKCFDDNFNFEKEFNELTKELKLTLSDIFFLGKLKKELIFIIDTINDQNKFSSFNNALYENKIFVNKEGNIKLTFMGIIDKLLYKKENNVTYLVIIDYKTGSAPTNLNNSIYGINMQLPVYLYLANEKINNAKVIGFYLQKILNPQVVKQNNKTYEKIKKDNLKLQGYSINDEDLLKKFDSTYRDSEVIKSMKVSSNGFYSYSKIINEEQIKKLIDLTKKNINNAFDQILECKFDINPKRIGKELIGCEFCKYKDICYMKEEDIINLREYKNLEFLE